MKFKGLFPDKFYEVEADSESQAEAKLLELLAADLRSKAVAPIMWEEPVMCKHDDGDCHEDDPCTYCPRYSASKLRS